MATQNTISKFIGKGKGLPSSGQMRPNPAPPPAPTTDRKPATHKAGTKRAPGY
jgi:hypothetical protein